MIFGISSTVTKLLTCIPVDILHHVVFCFCCFCRHLLWGATTCAQFSEKLLLRHML